MKVWAGVPHPSIALDRIRKALVAHAPGDVEFVEIPWAADLRILMAIGRQDRVRALARLGPYAVIQIALQSTMRPDPESWADIWRGAKVVWSYLDLQKHAPRFYYAPLGVDSHFVPPETDERPFLVMVNGQSWLSEGVKEAILAARAVGGAPFLLGPASARRGHPVAWGSELTEEQLVHAYQRCWWVTGLRRTEGFELPAAEGLLCGCRPILYDQPHFRYWYRDLATYIPEGSRPEVIASLKNVFASGLRPVAPWEREWAAKQFFWPKIIEGFWRWLR